MTKLFLLKISFNYLYYSIQKAEYIMIILEEQILIPNVKLESKRFIFVYK